MLDFFYYGEQLVKALDSIGDFLLNTSITVSQGFCDFLVGALAFLRIPFIPSIIHGLTPLLTSAEFTLVSLVIGGTLLLMVVLKFARFLIAIIK